MHFRNLKKAPKVFKEKDIAKTLPELNSNDTEYFNVYCIVYIATV